MLINVMLIYKKKTCMLIFQKCNYFTSISIARFFNNFLSVFRIHFQEQPINHTWSKKQMFLKTLQNSKENTSAGVSFLINCRLEECNFVKRETLVQVFSCEYFPKNSFFTEKSQGDCFYILFKLFSVDLLIFWCLSDIV